MRRRVWSWLAIALAAAPAAAFEGRVVDPQGQPLANAEVYVLGRPGEAITDADGRFEWKPDPSAPFEVLVVLRSGAYMKPVLVESLERGVPITLTVQPAVSESLVVSGSAPGIETTPAAGTATLSAVEIETRQPGNLVQAVESVAGVSQVSEGQAAVPAVRGLFAGRTLILIDGARVTSERRVGPSATFLDPVAIGSVEVSRGPGSVAYGSDAFGGVISVRTRRPEPGSGWQARLAALVSGEGRPEQRASALVSKGLEEGGFLFGAHAREADDWEGPDGPVLNSGYRDHGFHVRFENRLGPGLFSASVQGDFGRDVERPRSNSTSVRFFYPEEESSRLSAAYETGALPGFARAGLNLFAGTYDQITEQDRFATATSGRSIERAVISADDFQLRGFVEKHLAEARVEAGLDVNGRTGLRALEGRIAYDLEGSLLSDVTTVAIGDAERVDTGLYGSVDVALRPRLTLAGGLRGDYVTTDNSGGFFGDRSTSHSAVSGFLALTAGSASGMSATVQVARGFRDPTLSDRYYRGPTGRGFITGNPALDPERSLQWDLAVRYAGRRARLAVFYYDYSVEDLIERYETEPDFFLFRNRGEARLRGFEVEAQGELGAGVTMDLAAQVAGGEAEDDGSALDGIAPFSVSLQLQRQFGERISGRARVAYFDDDDEPGPTERRVPGYTLVDLSCGVEVTRALELRVLVRNLLDEAYLASQDNRAVPAPGRSVALLASVVF